jgi:hypothetical protein
MRRWLIEWSIRALIIAAVTPGVAFAGPGGRAGESGTVEGTVREINKTHHTVYLANGTMLWTSDMKLLDQLAPGTRIRAAFEDRGTGQKFINRLEIVQ